MSVSYVFAKLLKKLRGNAIKASSVHPTSKLESGSLMVDSTMGRHSFCGYDCSIVHCDVGSFTSISNRVTIGGVAHPMAFVSTSPAFLSHKDSIKTKFAQHEYLPRLRTVIGHDVWIGEGALIKAGITIGHGAVVGMGSVVTKNVAPYEVVAGNPARRIRMRFDDQVAGALLRLEWWNLPDAELRRMGANFNDPQILLKQEGLL